MEKQSFDYTGAQMMTPEVFGSRIERSRRWVLMHSRPGVEDPIPHLKFGRVLRYAWGSPELNEWIARRRS